MPKQSLRLSLSTVCISLFAGACGSNGDDLIQTTTGGLGSASSQGGSTSSLGGSTNSQGGSTSSLGGSTRGGATGVSGSLGSGGMASNAGAASSGGSPSTSSGGSAGAGSASSTTDCGAAVRGEECTGGPGPCPGVPGCWCGNQGTVSGQGCTEDDTGAGGGDDPGGAVSCGATPMAGARCTGGPGQCPSAEGCFCTSRGTIGGFSCTGGGSTGAGGQSGQGGRTAQGGNAGSGGMNSGGASSSVNLWH